MAKSITNLNGAGYDLYLAAARYWKGRSADIFLSEKEISYSKERATKARQLAYQARAKK